MVKVPCMDCGRLHEQTCPCDWYVVGEYCDPQPEDMLKYFESRNKAICVATERSELNRNIVFSVWENGLRCLAVFINGEQFNAS